MGEYFHFVDYVRDTKILEYAVAFLFIGLFAIYYKLMQAPAQPVEAKETVVSRAINMIKGFLVPEGVSYHPGHTWAHTEGEGLAAVGVDDFAQKLIGKIDKVVLPQVGDTVRQGEKAWTLVIDGKSIDMLSPVSGEVVEVNAGLAESAQAINDDPYGAWMVKVQSPKLSVSLKNLLSGVMAQKWTETAVENLFAKAHVEMGAVAGDGGSPVSGVAKNLDPEHWDEVAKEFFLTE